MGFEDTAIGGPGGGFPRTTLGLFSRIRDADEKIRRESLGELCRRYWKPVYRFVRIAWAKSNEDAKDLTQAFFLWLVEGETLERYAPERGSFRGYLRHMLSCFVGNRDRALAALKRGGGARILSLDGGESVLGKSVEDPDALTPEQAFDREWLRTLVQRALERVRVRFARGGRERQYRAYEKYEMAPEGGRPSYAQVGSGLGMSEDEVRRALEAVREAVGIELREELSQTTWTVKELEEEWNAFFGS